MEDITLCRSCFCYASANECGRVWQQYFNMFVLCVKIKKNSSCGGIEQSCAIWGQFHFLTDNTFPSHAQSFQFGPSHLTFGHKCALVVSEWLSENPWCRSFVVWTPIQDCPNPNAAVQTLLCQMWSDTLPTCYLRNILTMFFKSSWRLRCKNRSSCTCSDPPGSPNRRPSKWVPVYPLVNHCVLFIAASFFDPIGLSNEATYRRIDWLAPLK